MQAVVVEHHVALARVGRRRIQIQHSVVPVSAAMAETIQRVKPEQTTAVVAVVERRVDPVGLLAQES